LKDFEEGKLKGDIVAQDLRTDFEIIKKTIGTIQGDLSAAKKRTLTPQPRHDNNMDEMCELKSQIVRII